MPSASILLTLTLLNVGLALVPGPDVLCILTNVITRGARAGVMVCLGIASAWLVHVGCATFGLTALLKAVPVAYTAVKLAGAAYLVRLGWQMLRRPTPVMPSTQLCRVGSPFTQGALSNLLNPKVAMFFVAILPQFVIPERGTPGSQALVLGLTVIFSGTAVNLVTASLGARARTLLLVHTTLFGRIQQVSGLLFIGLGLHVALDRAR